MQVPDGELVARVDADEAVGDEGEVADGEGGCDRGGRRRRVLGSKRPDDALGAEDVDFRRAILRLGGADGEEGLDRVVGESAGRC